MKYFIVYTFDIRNRKMHLHQYESPNDKIQMFKILQGFKPTIEKQPFTLKNIKGVPESMFLYNGERRIVVCDNDNSNEFSSFIPKLMVAFSHMFSSKRVLDLSSSLSALMGCIASPNVEYYLGTDPNSVVGLYAEMIETFGVDTTNYRVVESKFQDFVNSDEFASEDEFDLIISTIVEQQLLDDCLLCMRNAFNKLRVNGHMIVGTPVSGDSGTKTSYIREMLLGMTRVPGCIYMGCIAQGNQPFWIWRKTDWSEISETPEHINPPLIVIPTGSIKVIRDDFLLAGTKQRGIIDMFHELPEQNIVYAGPTTEFAQVAVALGARLSGKNAIIFTSRSRPLTMTTRLAIQLGAFVYECSNREKFRVLRDRAAQYVSENPDSVAVNFDFVNVLFRSKMIQNIRSASEGVLDTQAKHTFWVVAGSAVLLRILYDIFPNSWFNVVQVGKEIDWFVDFNRSRLFVAPEWFFHDAQELPPYPSVSNYDAKVWQFVKEHGRSDDFIWNVAKDPELVDFASIDNFESEDGWTSVGRKNKRRKNKRW